MQFRVVIGEQVYAIDLPEDLLPESAEFHAKAVVGRSGRQLGAAP